MGSPGSTATAGRSSGAARDISLTLVGRAAGSAGLGGAPCQAKLIPPLRCDSAQLSASSPARVKSADRVVGLRIGSPRWLGFYARGARGLTADLTPAPTARPLSVNGEG